MPSHVGTNSDELLNIRIITFINRYFIILITDHILFVVSEKSFILFFKKAPIFLINVFYQNYSMLTDYGGFYH